MSCQFTTTQINKNKNKDYTRPITTQNKPLQFIGKMLRLCYTHKLTILKENTLYKELKGKKKKKDLP